VGMPSLVLDLRAAHRPFGRKVDRLTESFAMKNAS